MDIRHAKIQKTRRAISMLLKIFCAFLLVDVSVQLVAIVWMSARQNMESQRIQRGIPNHSNIDEALELVKLTDTGRKPVRNFSLGISRSFGWLSTS